MNAIILDTETTGIKPPVEAIEVGYIRLRSCIEPHCVEADFVGRYAPSRPIETGALATHHIMDEDLLGHPPSGSFRLPDGVEYLIGHNVDYDWGVIGRPEVRRICTLAMSRYLWPDVSHSLGAMIYLLERDRARELTREAHGALPDCRMCLIVLRHIFRRLGDLGVCPEHWGGLWEVSEKARLPTVMPFGKHAGKRITELPSDYKDWLLRQPDLDPYLVKALRS